MYIFKLIGTAAVSLTFAVVCGYLSIVVEGGILRLLKNANLSFTLYLATLS